MMNSMSHSEFGGCVVMNEKKKACYYTHALDGSMQLK
jgi:hypothetical protein